MGFKQLIVGAVLIIGSFGQDTSDVYETSVEVIDAVAVQLDMMTTEFIEFETPYVAPKTLATTTYVASETPSQTLSTTTYATPETHSTTTYVTSKTRSHTRTRSHTVTGTSVASHTVTSACIQVALNNKTEVGYVCDWLSIRIPCNSAVKCPIYRADAAGDILGCTRGKTDKIKCGKQTCCY